MTHYNVPELSKAGLAKSVLAAATASAMVLLVCILPAEYNIDPTGLGKAMGLTTLAQVDAAPQDIAKLEQASGEFASMVQSLSVVEAIAQERATNVSEDEVEILLPAGKGIEYKLLMDKSAHLEYGWKTDGAELYFDFHGEPEGDTTGYFESFAITTSDSMKGSLTAPFTGSHGWYWKNRSEQPVTITLSIKGDYRIKG